MAIMAIAEALSEGLPSLVFTYSAENDDVLSPARFRHDLMFASVGVF